MQDNVRSPTPPPLSGAPRHEPLESSFRFAWSPTRNGDSSHVGLGTAAEGLNRSSWPTRPLRPRGGHGWLSTSFTRALSDLGKFEKLSPRRTLGDLTSLKGLGDPVSVFHPSSSIGMPNH